MADVIRPLDGPLAEVRGLRPEAASYEGSAEHLQSVWVAVRASLRSVLEQVTIADIVSGELPRSVVKLTDRPGRLDSPTEPPAPDPIGSGPPLRRPHGLGQRRHGGPGGRPRQA